MVMMMIMLMRMITSVVLKNKQPIPAKEASIQFSGQGPPSIMVLASEVPAMASRSPKRSIYDLELVPIDFPFYML